MKETHSISFAPLLPGRAVVLLVVGGAALGSIAIGDSARAAAGAALVGVGVPAEVEQRGLGPAGVVVVVRCGIVSGGGTRRVVTAGAKWSGRAGRIGDVVRRRNRRNRQNLVA